MKTIGKIICLVVMPYLTATAQTDKGRWQVAAQLSNLSYQSNSSSQYTTLSATLTPTVGCFLAKNILVGIGVPLTLETTNVSNAFGETRSGIGLAPFIQYYIGQSALKPYIGGSYSYSFDKYRFDYGNSSGSYAKKGSSSAIVPTIGLAYFLNKSVALNAGLMYSVGTVELNGPSTNTPTVIIDASKSDIQSLSFGFGVQIALGK